MAYVRPERLVSEASGGVNDLESSLSKGLKPEATLYSIKMTKMILPFSPVVSDFSHQYLSMNVL